MTAAVARWATDDDHPLIEDYATFCHELGITDRALRDRLGLARAFLGQHGDLDAWLARPTRTRLTDLQRIKAWSLVSWAALTDRVQIDLDLLAAKDLGRHDRHSPPAVADRVRSAMGGGSPSRVELLLVPQRHRPIRASGCGLVFIADRPDLR